MATKDKGVRSPVSGVGEGCELSDAGGRTELKSSGKAATALDHHAISLAP